MRLRLHPAALAELKEAVSYLESQRPGVGEALFAEVSRRVAPAARLPRSGSAQADTELKSRRQNSPLALGQIPDGHLHNPAGTRAILVF